MSDEIQRRDILEKLDHNHIAVVERLATLTVEVSNVKDQVSKQNGNVARHEQSINELKLKDTAQTMIVDGLKKDGEKNDKKWGSIINWGLTIVQTLATAYLLIKFGLK